MEVLASLGYGFQVALQPANLMFGFIGVFIGTAVGVLPGLGAPGAIALLLPLTFGLDPVASIIMVSGIYYGTMYGGSTTSILVNIPGEAASVVTALDGYKMARKGRAGVALGMCALASFVAGTIGIILVTIMAPFLARVALSFGPVEYTVLLALGLVFASTLASGSRVKGMLMVVLGLILGVVGIDPIAGTERFTFDTVYLLDGVSFVVVVMGIFGIAEVLVTIREKLTEPTFLHPPTGLRNLLPNRRDWSDAAKPIARGSLVGFLLGLLPGGGAVMASFLAYAAEKRLSRRPERFGTGIIEGVAAPEAANNAASTAAFVPLLTLGIPFNAVTALILAALLLHGVRPGPLLMSNHAEIFWGVIASMYIGNVILLILNLPLVGLFIQILRVPYPVLFPLILLVTMLGSYSINNSVLDVGCALAFGMLGYALRRSGFELAPLALGLILGPQFEASLRQSIILSQGNPGMVLDRPIAVGMLIAVAGAVLVASAFRWRKTLATRQGASHGGNV